MTDGTNNSSMTANPLYFLDFEASSLEGWPIEIGVSWIAQNSVETWSSLIRPRTEWSDQCWDPAAYRTHGISRTELDFAPPANDVASVTRGIIGNGKLLSDAPAYDAFWLEQLTQEALQVESFHALAARTFAGTALDYLYERLERAKAPHRAGPDSARLAKAWLRAMQISKGNFDQI